MDEKRLACKCQAEDGGKCMFSSLVSSVLQFCCVKCIEMCRLQLADIQSCRFLAEFAKDLYQKQRKGEFQLGKAFEPLLPYSFV